METAARPSERIDFETIERQLDDDVLLHALLALAESAERNRQQSRSEDEDDGPLPEAA